MVRRNVRRHRRPSRGPGFWLLGVALGGLWCWAVFRLLTQPGRTGLAEALIATGGWGLSLLPVHCTPRRERRRPGPRGGGPGAGEP
ncbi:hypothetical protein [Streptomyces sp. NPDC053048]|uniref:hypothetical protein n=1 Tax=Streptomyces sp. NPDC053048 TaxID=3365694 RepID=UPI0037D87B47